MMNERLAHDVAWSGAMEVVAIFASLLREEEQRDALEEVYCACRTMLDSFVHQSQREAQRLCRPTQD